MPTRFMATGSTYNKRKSDYAVAFIQAVKHTKGGGEAILSNSWIGQKKIVCDLFGTVKDDGYRQFTTVYVEFPKKH